MSGFIERFHGWFLKRYLKDKPFDFGKIIHVSTSMNAMNLFLAVILPIILCILTNILFVIFLLSTIETMKAILITVTFTFFYLLVPTCVLWRQRSFRSTMFFENGMRTEDGSWKRYVDISRIFMVNCNPGGIPFPGPYYVGDEESEDPGENGETSENLQECDDSNVISNDIIMSSDIRDQIRSIPGPVDNLLHTPENKDQFDGYEERENVEYVNDDEIDDEDIPDDGKMKKSMGHEWKITLKFKNEDCYDVSGIKEVYLLHSILKEQWNTFYIKTGQTSRIIRGKKFLGTPEEMRYPDDGVIRDTDDRTEVVLAPYYKIWIVMTLFLGLASIAIMDLGFDVYSGRDVPLLWHLRMILYLSTIHEICAMVIWGPIISVLHVWISYERVDHNIYVKDGELQISENGKDLIKKYSESGFRNFETWFASLFFIPLIMIILVANSLDYLLLHLILGMLLIVGFIFLARITPMIWAKTIVRSIRNCEHRSGERFLASGEIRNPSTQDGHLEELREEHIREAVHRDQIKWVYSLPLIMVLPIFHVAIIFRFPEGWNIVLILDIFLLIFVMARYGMIGLMKSNFHLYEEAIVHEFMGGPRLIPAGMLYYTAGLNRSRKRLGNHGERY